MSDLKFWGGQVYSGREEISDLRFQISNKSAKNSILNPKGQL